MRPQATGLAECAGACRKWIPLAASTERSVLLLGKSCTFCAGWMLYICVFRAANFVRFEQDIFLSTHFRRYDAFRRRGRPPAEGDSAARHAALPARENKKNRTKGGQRLRS